MSAEADEVNEFDAEQAAEELAAEIEDFIKKSGIPDQVREFLSPDEIEVQNFNTVRRALVDAMLELAGLVKEMDLKSGD